MESALRPNSTWLFPYGITPISIHCYILLIDSVSIFYHGITFPYGIICNSICKLIWSSCPLFWDELGVNEVNASFWYSVLFIIPIVLVYAFKEYINMWGDCMFYSDLSGPLGVMGGSVLNKDRLSIIFWETIMRRREKNIFWWIRGKYLFSTDMITQYFFL